LRRMGARRCQVAVVLIHHVQWVGSRHDRWRRPAQTGIVRIHDSLMAGVLIGLDAGTFAGPKEIRQRSVRFDDDLIPDRNLVAEKLRLWCRPGAAVVGTTTEDGRLPIRARMEAMRIDAALARQISTVPYRILVSRTVTIDAIL